MQTPREFFEQMIEVAYSDWQQDRLSERKLRTVTILLDSMADWMFVYCELSKKYGPERWAPARYRDDLATKNPAFIYIRDTADCTKHLELVRKSAVSKSARLQRLFRYSSFDEIVDVDALDDWDTQSVWIVQSNESMWFLSPQIDYVLAMWKAELVAADL